jgi:5-methylcytosine-specific restriction enzyme A
LPTMHRACAWRGCSALAKQGKRYCDQHQAEAWKQRDGFKGGRPEHYTTGHWHKLRLVVLRAEPLCRICKSEGRTEAATVVDHIKPLAEGGTDARDNLQPLCKQCHDMKTVREVARRGR